MAAMNDETKSVLIHCKNNSVALLIDTRHHPLSSSPIAVWRYGGRSAQLKAGKRDIQILQFGASDCLAPANFMQKHQTTRQKLLYLRVSLSHSVDPSYFLRQIEFHPELDFRSQKLPV
jgi:hypothetical protein